MNIITKPGLDQIKSMDISKLYPLAADNADNRRLLHGEAGVEHYKLLAWLSEQFDDSIIVEIGTLGGLGTIALSYNPTNKVTSFDIRSYNWGNETPENAEKKIVYDGYMDEVTKADLIFYDAAHEGLEEAIFFDELLNRNWHGVVVWDDIHLNPAMEEFWKEKVEAGFIAEDWTSLGHSCGTGVIFL